MNDVSAGRGRQHPGQVPGTGCPVISAAFIGPVFRSLLKCRSSGNSPRDPFMSHRCGREGWNFQIVAPAMFVSSAGGDGFFLPALSLVAGRSIIACIWRLTAQSHCDSSARG